MATDSREERRVILLRAIDTQVRARVLREKSAWLRDDAHAVFARIKRARAQARRGVLARARRGRRYNTAKRAA